MFFKMGRRGRGGERGTEALVSLLLFLAVAKRSQPVKGALTHCGVVVREVGGWRWVEG